VPTVTQLRERIDRAKRSISKVCFIALFAGFAIQTSAQEKQALSRRKLVASPSV
jgi:hypothetical protein